METRDDTDTDGTYYTYEYDEHGRIYEGGADGTYYTDGDGTYYDSGDGTYYRNGAYHDGSVIDGESDGTYYNSGDGTAYRDGEYYEGFVDGTCAGRGCYWDSGDGTYYRDGTNLRPEYEDDEDDEDDGEYPAGDGTDHDCTKDDATCGAMKRRHQTDVPRVIVPSVRSPSVPTPKVTSPKYNKDY